MRPFYEGLIQTACRPEASSLASKTIAEFTFICFMPTLVLVSAVNE